MILVTHFMDEAEDGSSRLEAEDGRVALISPDRRQRIDEDPRTSLFRLTAGDQEIAHWERNSAGVIEGRFHRMKVEAERGETLQLSKDGNTVYALKGADSDGNAIVSSWTTESDRGIILPDKMGQAVKRISHGQVDKVVIFQPPSILLGKIASGAVIDLSMLEKEGFLSAQSAEAYLRVLKVLPEINPSFRGNAPIQSLAIENGKLEISFAFGGQATAFLENNAVQLFMFYKEGRTALWKFNPEINSCDVLELDRTVAAQEGGKVVFHPAARYVKQADRWTYVGLRATERTSVTLMTLGGMGSTVWGGVKGVGRGVGHVMTVAFSLPQTALYDVEGAISFAGGMGSEFSTVQSVYTMRQATINRWVGKGLQNPKQIEEAYSTAIGMLSNKSQSNVEKYLDAEIDSDRHKTYGALYWKHKNDPVTFMERANMAARKFGQANVASQYTERGGVVNYAIAGTAIAGEGYVSGVGFGAAAAPLKGLVASKMAGTSINALNQGLKVAAAGGKVTDDTAKALSYFKNINRGEMGLFTIPTAIDVADHASGLLTDGQSHAKEHLDGIFNSVAGYGPMIGGLARAQALDIARRITAAKTDKATPDVGPPADKPSNQGPENTSAGKTVNPKPPEAVTAGGPSLAAKVGSLLQEASKKAAAWLAAKVAVPTQPAAQNPSAPGKPAPAAGQPNAAANGGSAEGGTSSSPSGNSTPQTTTANQSGQGNAGTAASQATSNANIGAAPAQTPSASNRNSGSQNADANQTTQQGTASAVAAQPASNQGIFAHVQALISRLFRLTETDDKSADFKKFVTKVEVAKAQGTLGRKLTEQQQDAVVKAFFVGRDEKTGKEDLFKVTSYTETIERGRILTEAGFTLEETHKLMGDTRPDQSMPPIDPIAFRKLVSKSKEIQHPETATEAGNKMVAMAADVLRSPKASDAYKTEVLKALSEAGDYEIILSILSVAAASDRFLLSFSTQRDAVSLLRNMQPPPERSLRNKIITDLAQYKLNRDFPWSS